MSVFVMSAREHHEISDASGEHRMPQAKAVSNKRILSYFENTDFLNVRSNLILDLVPDLCVEKRLA